MFDSKKITLGEKKASVKSSIKGTSVMNSDQPFLKAAMKESSKTTSLGNGALKYTTTGSDFVDQFGKITNYRSPRRYSEIAMDMSTLWANNPLLTICLAFYIRMITRIVQLFDGRKTTTTQRGQGLKYEGIMRMMWISIEHPESFWKNIALWISIGSWKDIISMLQYDLVYHGWNNRVLDWNKFGQLILAGLENPNTSELLKKYLPQIKAKSQCHTVEAEADNMIAKWICSLLFEGEKISNYKKYRKLKSSGTAHQWQQLISQGRFLEIDFNTVHGRALSQMVSGKFLANHNLEDKYEQWIESKPVAKYTGFVYELMAPVKVGYQNRDLKKYQVNTINKQFYNLIEVAKNGMKQDSSLIVVLDTSSSMTSPIPGVNVSAYSVGKAMALYFSYLLKGPFAKAFFEFADECELKYWKGSTPVENLQNDRSEAYGSTNFQSVADTFVKLREQGVAEEDFPTGILCISDGCFNSTKENKTNFKELIEKLRTVFSSEFVNNFKVILWDIPNDYYGKSQTAFEDFADTPNLFHISGLDPSAVAFITGTEYNKSIPKTSEELFLAAMNQEVLNMIEV
jgi:hypothetical protein